MGVYAHTKVDELKKCTDLSANFETLRDSVHDFDAKFGASVIFLGDMNVHDNSESLNSVKGYERTWSDYVGARMRNKPRFRVLSETISDPLEFATIEKLGNVNFAELLAPILVSERLVPAVVVTDRITERRQVSDANGNSYEVGKVLSAFLEFDATQIQPRSTSLPDLFWLILLVIALLIGLFIFRLTRQKPNSPAST